MGVIKIPQGKKILIRKGSEFVTGDIDLVLDDPITLNLSSNWEPFMNKTGNAKLLSLLGSFVRDAVGREAGFSGQSSLMGYQVFTGGEPLSFNITVTLHVDKTNVNGLKQVMEPTLKLLTLPLPYKNSKSILVPPGPSIAALIKGFRKNDGGFPETEEETLSTVQKFIQNTEGEMISIKIGRFLDLRMAICIQAEPTFSLETDELGWPMWSKLSMDFRSVEIAHIGMMTNVLQGTG